MNNGIVKRNNDIIFYTTDDGQIKIEVRLEMEYANRRYKYRYKII